MTEKKKTQTPKKVETPKVNPEPNSAAPKQPPKITIQDVINNYPPDREKVRDQLLLAISNDLTKIATTLDWFARRKQEEIDRTIKLKD